MDEIRGMPGWRRVRKLGAGSYGTVYEIQKEESGHTYRAALKLISVPRDESELQSAYADGMDADGISGYYQTLVESISEECAMMRQLSGSANIVAYQGHQIIPHENGVGADILIRMELLEPLTQVIAQKRMDEAQVLQLGTDLCRALELCEKKNIVHRDVKPANIFVSENGDYKLGDFGIARTMSTHGTMTSKRGTYTYMAPEVYFGRKDYDHTADLYSLGLVLYWCLNERRLPFEPPAGSLLTVKDRENALDERLDGKPIPRPAQCSDELWEVIQRATFFERQKRYQSALDMKLALTKCMFTAGRKENAAEEPSDAFDSHLEKTSNVTHSAPEEEAPPGDSESPEDFPAPAGGKGKRWLAIVAALVLLVGAALAAVHYFAGKSGSEPSLQTPGESTVEPAAETAEAVIQPETLPTVFSSSDMEIRSPDILLSDTETDCMLVHDGTYMMGGSDVVWQSSDPSVLSVTAGGTLCAHAAGTAVITAEHEGDAVSKEIYVVEPNGDSGVTLEPDISDLKIPVDDMLASSVVNITAKGVIPAQNGLAVYTSGGVCNADWGVAKDQTIPLEISALGNEGDEFGVYVMMFADNDPTNVIAYTVIHITLTA